MAALEGVRLEMHNRGIPGQLHWRAALRFGWDLTVDPEPDLVVFYNGAEELAAAEALEEQGLGDVRAPYEPFLEDLYDEVHDVTGPLPPPEDVEFLGWPKVREVHGDAPRLAVVRYDRSRGISRNLAAAADVPVMYVWQPGGADRGPDHAAVSRLLPRDVVDLADLFDGADVRFVDGFDLTERGAHRVAEQLYPLVREHLEPALRRPGGGR